MIYKDISAQPPKGPWHAPFFSYDPWEVPLTVDGMFGLGLPFLCSLWAQRVEGAGRKLEEGSCIPPSSLIKTFLVSWVLFPVFSILK